MKNPLPFLNYYFNTNFLPRVVDLEVSKLCNLQCPMCYRSVAFHPRKKINNPFLTPRKLNFFLKEIPSIKRINFIGTGEPLTNPYFFELLEITTKKNIQSEFTTNATLLNKSNISKLKKNKIRKIWVSIESTNPEQYEKFRKGAKLKNVIENLKLLSSTKIPITLQAIITKENFKELPYLLNLGKEIGIKEFSFFSPIFFSKETEKKRFIPNSKETKIIKEIKKECCRNKIIFSGRSFLPVFRECYWPFREPFISIDGDVYPCCFIAGMALESINKEYFKGKEIKIQTNQYKMGNLFTQNFKEIWKNKSFKSLRKLIKKTRKRKGTKITFNRLKKERKEIRKERFSYCRVCSWRWGLSC